MAEVDPWEMAAACQRAIDAASNDMQRSALRYIRRLWTTLANESVFMSADELAQETEKIHRLHQHHFVGFSASSGVH
jgi:hypothetical protein